MEGLAPALSADLLAFAVFLAAIRLERPGSAPLARIGLVSHAMYLFHGPVNADVYRASPLTGQFGDIGTMLICIGLTLARPSRAVERPMMRLGRSLSSQREAPVAYSIALKRLR